MKNIKISIFLSMCFLLFTEEIQMKWEVGKNIEDFIEYEKNVEIKRINNKPIYYCLKKIIPGVSENVDLYLPFDTKTEKDKTGNYNITYSKFLLSNNIYFNNNSAYFISNEDKLELIGNKKSFFQAGITLGSFSISFWIYPVSTSKEEIILNIGGHYYNKENDKTEEEAIICKLKNGKIVWEFINVFFINNTKIDKINLYSITTIIPERWALVNLTYNSYNGIIKLYINGTETGIGIATIDGNLHSSVLNIMFNSKNKCFIKIAPSFIGAIDEFYIFKDIVVVSNEKYFSQGGEIISKVIDLGKGGGRIKKIYLEDFKDNNSEIFYFYRYYDKPFYPNEQYSEDIKWNLLDINKIPLNKIRYIQWKILLLPGNDNNISPFFKFISITYDKDIPPAKPIGLKAIAKDSGVILKWTRNSEKDVKGYKIYYGIKSNYYFGKGALNGDSPIIISTLENFDKDGIAINGLRNNTLYYFSVTAFDDEDKTNESEFSEEISIRTVEGYVIDK